VISTQANTPAAVSTATVSPPIPANLEVINYETIKRVEKIVAIPLADVINLEFSPNGQYLRMRINLSQDNHRDIFMDLNTGMEALTLEGSQRIYFNSNSTSIVSLDGKSLVEYDLRTGEERVVYNSAYDVAALSPDGRWLVVFEEIDEDGPGTTFKIIDIYTEEEIHRIFVNTVMDKDNFQFDPDGELLAGTYLVPPDSHLTTFWSMETGKAVHTIYGYSEIAFNPFLREVAASNAKQNYISLISMYTWEQLRYLGGANDGPNYYNIGYTSYGGMVYALYDGIATYPWFWKPITGERVWWPVNFGNILDLTISPASNLLATSEKAGYVMIWGIPE
jgi:WD40 repeat protein